MADHPRTAFISIGVFVFIALVVAAIMVRRFPIAAEGGRPWTDYPRGHVTSPSQARDNLVVEIKPGAYPPRALGLPAQRRPPSDSWLLDADSDRDRFRRIETVLTPEQAMREIAVRFLEMRSAIDRDRLALAQYEWNRSTRAAEIALLMRPANQERVEEEFLLGPWKELGAALAARDPAGVAIAFEATRNACLQCHVTRGRAFLNDHPVFEAVAPLPVTPQ